MHDEYSLITALLGRMRCLAHAHGPGRRGMRGVQPAKLDSTRPGGQLFHACQPLTPASCLHSQWRARGGAAERDAARAPARDHWRPRAGRAAGARQLRQGLQGCALSSRRPFPASPRVSQVSSWHRMQRGSLPQRACLSLCSRWVSRKWRAAWRDSSEITCNCC